MSAGHLTSYRKSLQRYEGYLRWVQIANFRQRLSFDLLCKDVGIWRSGKQLVFLVSLLSTGWIAIRISEPILWTSLMIATRIWTSDTIYKSYQIKKKAATHESILNKKKRKELYLCYYSNNYHCRPLTNSSASFGLFEKKVELVDFEGK